MLCSYVVLTHLVVYTLQLCSYVTSLLARFMYQFMIDCKSFITSTFPNIGHRISKGESVVAGISSFPHQILNSSKIRSIYLLRISIINL